MMSDTDEILFDDIYELHEVIGKNLRKIIQYALTLLYQRLRE